MVYLHFEVFFWYSFMKLFLRNKFVKWKYKLEFNVLKIQECIGLQLQFSIDKYNEIKMCLFLGFIFLFFIFFFFFFWVCVFDYMYFAISSLIRSDSDLRFFIKVVDREIPCNLESSISWFGVVSVELHQFQFYCSGLSFKLRLHRRFDILALF